MDPMNRRPVRVVELLLARRDEMAAAAIAAYAHDRAGRRRAVCAGGPHRGRDRDATLPCVRDAGGYLGAARQRGAGGSPGGGCERLYRLQQLAPPQERESTAFCLTKRAPAPQVPGPRFLVALGVCGYAQSSWERR